MQEERRKSYSIAIIIMCIKRKKILIVLLFLLLFSSLWFNYPQYLSEYSNSNFDSWSNGIMVSDLSYRQNYKIDNSFLKAISPGMVVNNGTIINSGDDIVKAYQNNDKYQKNDYGTYQSNLCWHKYLYRFIDKFIPVSNYSMIQILYLLNSFFLALVLFYILLWIEKRTNTLTLVLTTIILSFFSPNLSMFAKNLYWISWSLFLPMAGAIFITNQAEKHKVDQISNKKVFLATFITCFIKQIFYFEFISTVMISMLVPYLYYWVMYQNSLKNIIKKSIVPFISGMTSFLVVSLLKLLMFVKDGSSFYTALKEYVGPIVYRLLGINNSQNELINESASVSNLKVFGIMLQKPAISLQYVVYVSQFLLIIIFIIMSIVLLQKIKKAKLSIFGEMNSMDESLEVERDKAWLAILWFSILAPVSWFVLAKPHTYIHNEHCSITWYIPWTILIIAFICYKSSRAIESVLCSIYVYLKNNKIRSVIIITTVMCLSLIFVKYSFNCVRNEKEISKVLADGREIYQEDNRKIYYYDKSLYYMNLDKKNESENYFIHLYYYDNDFEFENYDFVFKNNKLVAFPWYKYNVAKVELSSNRLINRIYTGQYDPYTGVRSWEGNAFISEQYVEVSSISVSMLSDQNWNYGLSNDRTTILLDDIREEYAQIEGKKILLDDGEEYSIKEIDMTEENYTHVILNQSIPEDAIFGENSNRILIIR